LEERGGGQRFCHKTIKEEGESTTGEGKIYIQQNVVRDRHDGKRNTLKKRKKEGLFLRLSKKEEGMHPTKKVRWFWEQRSRSWRGLEKGGKRNGSLDLKAE